MKKRCEAYGFEPNKLEHREQATRLLSRRDELEKGTLSDLMNQVKLRGLPTSNEWREGGGAVVLEGRWFTRVLFRRELPLDCA